MYTLSYLEKLATKRRVLKDEYGECVVKIKLTEPVSVWDMDQEKIEKAALNIKSKRCDFAVRQTDNPNDNNAHLILIECKASFRETDSEVKRIFNQLSGGLKILRHLAGGDLPFDVLTPVLVSPSYYSGGIPSAFEEFFIKDNNGNEVQIRIADSSVAIIDDDYVLMSDK